MRQETQTFIEEQSLYFNPERKRLKAIGKNQRRRRCQSKQTQTIIRVVHDLTVVKTDHFREKMAAKTFHVCILLPALMGVNCQSSSARWPIIAFHLLKMTRNIFFALNNRISLLTQKCKCFRPTYDQSSSQTTFPFLLCTN